MANEAGSVNPDLHGFGAICGSGATRLVLGSMPGAASLQAVEYYAHPRNAFWMIAESLFGIAREMPYADRRLGLEKARVAVWDVLKECRRRSSLDSDIERDSIVTNDFCTFLAQNPDIGTIYFNGNTARNLYDRYVLSALPEALQRIPRVTLPSTSPANARLSMQEKTRAWSVISGPD